MGFNSAFKGLNNSKLLRTIWRRRWSSTKTNNLRAYTDVPTIDGHHLFTLYCDTGGRRMFWDTRRIIYDQNLHSVDTEDYVRTTSTSKWQRLRLKLVYRTVLTNFLSSLCHHVYIQRIQRFTCTMLWISLPGTATRRSVEFSAHLQQIHLLVTKLRTLLPSWTNLKLYCVMLYAFFWVIPRRLNFICRRFGTLCLFHLHRRIGMKDINTPTFSNLVILYTYPPMKMEETECSEKSAYKIQTPGN